MSDARDGEVVPRQQVETIKASFTGPLPPPSMLADYEDGIPGSAERIITMAEAEQAHRHKIDSDRVDLAKSTLSNDHTEAMVVLIGEFGVTFAFLGFAIYGGVTGMEWTLSFVAPALIPAVRRFFPLHRDAADDDEEPPDSA